MMGKKGEKPGGRTASTKSSDARFSNFQSDPRFRLPSRKQTKTTLDKRFSSVLKSEEFISSAKVDKYGRKIKSDSTKKALKNLYRNEDEDDEDTDIDDDDLVQKELQAAKKYDPARDGGFSSSESDLDEDAEEAEDVLDVGASMQRFTDERAEVEEGDVTRRIAIVNLDWDYIKSHDLFALFSSFLPKGSNGKIDKVAIYPSEFGKERMQREAVEGPPKEIFQVSKHNKADEDDEDSAVDSDEEDEMVKKELLQEGDDEDFNSDALRSYQLDRLRYYYAVMECSDPKTAQELYETTDGTEYLSSSNFLDLRFVPDDVTFDDEARDECTSIPQGYKPIEFVTNALQSSKVKLTWDIHPEEATRKHSMQKAFTGSKDDLKDNDLRVYLASDSDDDDDENEDVGAGEVKLTKKELARRKLREALGLSDEPAAKKSNSGPVGEMQITFSSALSEGSKPLGKDGEAEETTIEKYKRKERERKEKRRQKTKARREGADEEEGDDEEHKRQDDPGFDDPFFTTEDAEQPSKTSIRKEERRKKREAREAEAAEREADNDRLRRAMDADDDADGMAKFNHFDMREILKAEKDARKKSKKKKGGKKRDVALADLQSGVKIQVDDRFKSLFQSHEFAIDPSHPQFKDTEATRKLMEVARSKRKASNDDGEERSRKGKKAKKMVEDETNLSSLVAAVKKAGKR